VAVLLAVTLGCLSLAIGVYAQAPTTPQDSGGANRPIAISSLVNAYAKGQAEKGTLTKEIKVEESNRKTLVVTQGAEETNRDNIDHQARTFNDSDESQTLSRDMDNYRATCAGKMLYGADISRCAAALNSINPRLADHNAKMNSFRDQVNAAEGQVQETKNEIVLADAKITKLRNYLSWLTDADSRMSTTLHEECAGLKSNLTIEELKHRCGNIQFDNARVRLPACETVRVGQYTQI